MGCPHFFILANISSIEMLAEFFGGTPRDDRRIWNLEFRIQDGGGGGDGIGDGIRAKGDRELFLGEEKNDQGV